MQKFLRILLFLKETFSSTLYTKVFSEEHSKRYLICEQSLNCTQKSLSEADIKTTFLIAALENAN